MIKSTRKLSKLENDIVAAMIDAGDVKWVSLKNELPTVLVTVMSDGGMGSIQFETMSTNIRKLGTVISEAEFVDTDGTLVSITLNLDQDDNLFELDVWKVDFKPLNSFPKASELKFR